MAHYNGTLVALALKLDWLSLKIQTKPHVLLALSCLLLTSCATKHRMDIDDLKYYQIDCEKKEAQKNFLISQLTTSDERVLTWLQMGGIGGILQMKLDGSAREKNAVMTREYDSVVKRLLWEIRTNCP